MNYRKFIRSKQIITFEMFNFSNMAYLIGNQLYAFESVPTLFTVRSTLKDTRNMPRVIFITFLFIIFLFSTNGISFLVTYGQFGLKDF